MKVQHSWSECQGTAHETCPQTGDPQQPSVNSARGGILEAFLVAFCHIFCLRHETVTVKRQG